jgi:effector-binding domain-containing protein
MQVKEVKPINFLHHRALTTVDQLAALIPVAREIYREAVERDLHITGPMHWHYLEFSGLDKPFTLEISLPVSHVLPDYDGKFHFKRTQLFKCVSHIHEGDWLDLPRTYNEMMQFIDKNKMDLTANNREIYINADFQDSDANITEVQIGIR